MTRRVGKRVLAVSLLVSFACTGLVSCDDESEFVSSTGTVVFNAFEGGFHGIIDDEGRRWDTENISDEFAVDSLRVSFQGVITDHATYHMWGRTLHLIGIKKLSGPPPVNLEPFRELARAADCADVRNRLFLVDNQRVFWDRESTCADATFDRELFGRTAARWICRERDSVSGPDRTCRGDGDQHSTIFMTIIENLDAPDLGLGAGHTVEPVDF